MLKKLIDQAKNKLEEQSSRLKDQALEKVNEAGENLQQIREKAEEKLSETSEQLKDLKEKVVGEFADKKEEILEMKEKAMEKLTLEHLLPEVKTILEQKVVPLLNIQSLGKALGRDRVEAAFITAYEFLPAPVRLVVGQETFLRFCHNHRANLLDSQTEQKLLGAQNTPTQRFSNADELIKLKQLLDTGVLTPEEFEIFKKQLM